MCVVEGMQDSRIQELVHGVAITLFILGFRFGERLGLLRFGFCVPG